MTEQIKKALREKTHICLMDIEDLLAALDDASCTEWEYEMIVGELERRMYNPM